MEGVSHSFFRNMYCMTTPYQNSQQYTQIYFGFIFLDISAPYDTAVSGIPQR